MLCIKCKKEMPEGAVFCPWCGKKQVAEKRKSRKRANAQGSVYKLSGNLKRPWIAMLPCKYDKAGNSKRAILGYYSTKTEGLNALNEAVAMNIAEHINFTLLKIYKEWSKIHFREISKSSIDNYTASWKYMSELKDKKMRDIRSGDVQAIIDDISASGKSCATCEKVKNLYSQLCKYAMSQDIITQNYAQFLKMPKIEKTEKKIFTPEQIDQIYGIALSGNETAMIIIILIYCGMRIGELFDILHDSVSIVEGYMIGGKKTEAGKNRIVPFNDKILPFAKHFYDKNCKYFIPSSESKQKSAGNFRSREFYPFLDSLGITGITPHSTRHTFATLGQAAGIAPEDMIKLIGHTDYKTTTETYIHQNLNKLKDAINKI